MIKNSELGLITIEKIEEHLFKGVPYRLLPVQKKRIKAAFDFLVEFSKDKVIYGINTGFGPMAQYVIPEDEKEQLQYNLIRSHAHGMGNPLPVIYVKSTMISRLQTLALGYSGVSTGTTKTLEAFLKHEIYPVIPTHGGVGASGDLVQLAHLALALIGEGEVFYKGEIRKTADVLEETGVKPVKLQIRDGLALMNGTSCMSGIAAVNVIYLKRLLNWTVLASSVMNELTASYDDSFSAELNESKKHDGQRVIAEKMRDHLIDGKILKKRNDHLFNGKAKDKKYFSEKVQEYYSLRCVPQILGPVWDAWKNACRVVEDEFNSANDNPVICLETRNVYHGGNFHGDYIAYEMDKLKIGVAKLSILLERQLNYLMNEKLNDKFPPFLNKGKPGFNFGLQGMQFAAVSTTAENQTLSNPMSVHSISNNGDNQDVVSMGTNAALLTAKVIDNAFEVLAIHLTAIAQAMDITNHLDRFSGAARLLHSEVRSLVPGTDTDESLHKNISLLKDHLISKDISE